ncbi:hypothetical protein MGYG_07188 [Nannizzia gypsea CBS 118893]|uniref:Uncharacterized protein n=1 Tax=Arthroderma gypseum (strain ATCC MYA-4604 / CBS 118893) TaxID=535722 RepID=E4V2B6_ARTGP|nr:hypothetical protein MGYG_07188 [Nannizzia gypsea CBS 118893]EFR04181.1 hypothetical protein MGYG_07188 [Nannizzia gypsea CBS 118893]
MAGKSKASKKQKSTQGFIGRRYKKFSKQKQDKLCSDSTSNAAQGDTYGHSDPNTATGLVWYPSHYDPACSPQPYHPMAPWTVTNNADPQWFGPPNRVVYASARDVASLNQAYWSPVPDAYPAYGYQGHPPPCMNGSWDPIPGIHEMSTWEGNQSQYVHCRNDSGRPQPVNEPSRLRGDAPEFVPTQEPQSEVESREDGFSTVVLDEPHSE